LLAEFPNYAHELAINSNDVSSVTAKKRQRLRMIKSYWCCHPSVLSKLVHTQEDSLTLDTIKNKIKQFKANYFIKQIFAIKYAKN